ncbi:hypothetical protein N7509_003915 [Penicillium cosmopolitanum]|uniref:Uncharacterized protein n=1 Tax=Penicillium cosmopolitanum TaxID=1131564 RepID=A0A9W9W5T0_9EURO|nr:uncharacterized protein N7509_003915 [Penicillium cosmopolitanum]KAJ5404044.1 hypothetical protein N7509_003915 [Penicillium cosmopolitanum]
MAPSAKMIRYSKTCDFDRYYESVFSKLSKAARHALLIQPKDPEYIGEQGTSAKAEAYEIFLKLSKTTQDSLLAQLKRLKSIKQGASENDQVLYRRQQMVFLEQQKAVTKTEVDEIFSKLPKFTQDAFLAHIKQLRNTEKEASQKEITQTKADEIKTLVKILRKQPVAYFRLAMQRARKKLEERQYKELEEMLSTREKELKYEKGELGSLFISRLIASLLTIHLK